ncbi:MAG: hypothetical protein QNJ44_01730 [Rhodobacter sp.]|nr:hypothetical protein [Rhodobacter sp.]
MTGMGALGAFLPLLGLLALIVTAVQRRREKKKRFGERDGRT